MHTIAPPLTTIRGTPRGPTSCAASVPVAGHSIASAIILAALSFNAVLAVISAHLVPLTSTAVIACEVVLVSAAYAVAIANCRREMGPWYVLAGMLVLIAIYRSLATQAIEPKLLRDVLLIPTFVVLGMTLDARRLNRLVVIAHTIVIVFLLLELLDESAYSNLFRIQEYYINTRALGSQNFWNKSSDLFVSATRPDERFFSFFSFHRMSSIFLEPVSLGNYCATITAFLCARWSSLSTFEKWFLAIGNVAAIIGCDGRFAAQSSLIMLAIAWIAPRLPRYSNVVYLPGVVAGVLAVTWIGGLHSGSDDFTGRIALTSEMLGKFDIQEFIGASDSYLVQAVDSGLAYLIATQSVIGVCIVWLFVVYATFERTPEQIRFSHAVCLYVSLSLMVSFSLFTIKTAALLWAIHGCLQARPRGNAREPAGWSELARRHLT